MKLGIALPLSGRDRPVPPTAEQLAASAALVERLGFNSLWTFDSISRGFILPDPLAVIAVAASSTKRIELGTGVLQVPLRRPVELAHRILTVHALSAGRLVLGVGAGSTAADFEAVGVDFGQRMALMDESLQIMRGLWRGEKVGAANLEPWPSTVGGPPVLIGSWAGSRWIPRAAQEFDGWVGSGARSTGAKLEEGIKRFRAAGGKRAIATNIHVDLADTAATMEHDGPFHLRCRSNTAQERLKWLAGLGFDEAVLVPRSADEATLTAIRALLTR
jgi:alkanesulfonate monooxygenase SsuD/methylene tetrahydromethanopterin reductase-like flavin-dependent oxidoreductase (luciferase family)